MSGSINGAFALLALLCLVHHSYQCSPGPDYKPPTIAELTQKAPIVVRGFVVKKGKDINRFEACLYISHVYKGARVKNYICVSGFGSSAACLSEPGYGTEYLFFLNRKVDHKLGTGYEARYDSIHSAVQVFGKDSEDGIRDGKCCPRTLKNCNSFRLFCSRGYCGHSKCRCTRGLKYRKV
ncbi:uncharacterized protein LOC114517693 [Dendronephthya gigantea]|uniref:uncharacterized protein LOC114517693 n=1 Tax=Dendronephthya gigantea TaxID=151771 RepID=UPI00106B09EB|nr:uncharacterized protein LOC114517693 [Dendronephthya gigantea]